MRHNDLYLPDTRQLAGQATFEYALRAALSAEAEAGPDYAATVHPRVMARVAVAQRAWSPHVQAPLRRLIVRLTLILSLLAVICLVVFMLR